MIPSTSCSRDSPNYRNRWAKRISTSTLCKRRNLRRRFADGGQEQCLHRHRHQQRRGDCFEPEHFEELLREPTASELIMKTVEARMKKMANIEEHIASLSLLSFGIENELPNGQSIMVINLDRCTRCDDCVKACADAHDGYPRFAREGRKIGNAMFPHACMHCIDPLCMDGCPSGALHRSKQHGEVLIDIDTCVGCTMCVTKCIYDNIVALPVAETVMMDADPVYQLNPANNKPVLKSMKCDLCVETGDPACVRSCPQDAMRRMSFNEILSPLTDMSNQTPLPQLRRPLARTILERPSDALFPIEGFAPLGLVLCAGSVFTDVDEGPEDHPDQRRALWIGLVLVLRRVRAG